MSGESWVSMEGERRTLKVRRAMEDSVEEVGVEVDAQLGEEMESPSWSCLAFSRRRML